MEVLIIGCCIYILVCCAYAIIVPLLWKKTVIGEIERMKEDHNKLKRVYFYLARDNGEKPKINLSIKEIQREISRLKRQCR